jgi:ABC-type transport system involved in cytochrome c biogenesis permease subunit
MISLFEKISMSLYAMAALFYLCHLIFRGPVTKKFAYGFTLSGFIVQTIDFLYLLTNIKLKGQIPSVSTDSYLLSAWILAGIFLFVRLRYNLETAGSLFLSFIFSLHLIAYLRVENYHSEILDSPWASIHIVFAFLSFSVFLLSFIMGCLFLLEEIHIKQKRSWILLERLPSLDLLDKLHYRALTVGFALLSIGILSGSAWAKSVKGVYFFNDPRQLWSIIAWCLYALFFQVRLAAGWRGRKGILLSLIGFVVVVFTFLEVQHL